MRNKTPIVSDIEVEYAKRGCYIAGVDEAGRGAIAGPVVAAAVVFSPEFILRGLPKRLIGLTDSKVLSPAIRRRFLSEFVQMGVEFSFACANQQEIDRINILNATSCAMIDAILMLDTKPDVVLIDGKPIKNFPFNAKFIVRGDSQCITIAAASIVAKVMRDRLMEVLDRLYPNYGFAIHKGYLTGAHYQAIQKHGACHLHRRSFKPINKLC